MQMVGGADVERIEFVRRKQLVERRRFREALRASAGARIGGRIAHRNETRTLDCSERRSDVVARDPAEARDAPAHGARRRGLHHRSGTTTYARRRMSSSLRTEAPAATSCAQSAGSSAGYVASDAYSAS